MGMFEVYDSQREKVLGTYNTIFDAYKSVNNNAIFLPVKEWMLSKTELLSNRDDLISFLQNLSDIKSSIKDCEDDINNWYILYISEDSTSPYIAADTEQYLGMINHLTKVIDMNLVIRKTKEYIIPRLKHYFEEHTNDFFDITLMISERQILSGYDWQKAKIQETDDIKYADDYNIEDRYNCIKDGKIHSATEMQVLNEYMKDMDHIIDVIYENRTDVFVLGIKKAIINIMK